VWSRGNPSRIGAVDGAKLHGKPELYSSQTDSTAYHRYQTSRLPWGSESAGTHYNFGPANLSANAFTLSAEPKGAQENDSCHVLTAGPPVYWGEMYQ